MKHDVTPEEKTGPAENAPPAMHSLPLPKDTTSCVGCPYPSVGFEKRCQAPHFRTYFNMLTRTHHSRGVCGGTTENGISELNQ